MAEILRYAAFTLDGEGGNPAGVVLDAARPGRGPRCSRSRPRSTTPRPRSWCRATTSRMCTTFATSPRSRRCPSAGTPRSRPPWRWPSGTRWTEMVFHTPAGLVTINTEETQEGIVAELTSISPRISEPPDGLVERCLSALHWSADDLDPSYPPRLANAGSEHLVLVTRTHQRLADLDYDFDALAAIMREHGIITLQLIWPKSEALGTSPATRSPAAVWSRTRQPVPPRPRSAATCASSARSATRRGSRSARAPRSAGPA